MSTLIDLDTLRESIRDRLSRPFKTRHQTAALAGDIFELMNRTQNASAETAGYRAAFLHTLELANMTDLLSHQIEYAIRLATDRRDLLYEEMHKLFSLRDEIEALRSLGLVVSEDVISKLEGALKYRFEREPKNARFVAENRHKDWKKDWWWYSVNLSGKRDS